MHMKSLLYGRLKLVTIMYGNILTLKDIFPPLSLQEDINKSALTMFFCKLSLISESIGIHLFKTLFTSKTLCYNASVTLNCESPN